MWKTTVLPGGQGELFDGALAVTRLAEDAVLDGRHLIGPDDQGPRVLGCNSARLGLRQTNHQAARRLAGLPGLIDLRCDRGEGQPQPLQQGTAVG